MQQAILNQPIRQNGIVEIGEGSWLGHNACVLGASIGKHCVIGANSVVTHDIPDYSVAVGSPAKIIRRYDSTTKTWRSFVMNYYIPSNLVRVLYYHSPSFLPSSFFPILPFHTLLILSLLSLQSLSPISNLSYFKSHSQ